MTESARPGSGLIRIVRVPDGEAPPWVREKWVGLVLPCDPFCGFPSTGVELGVVSQRQLGNRSGFSVPQDRALAILEERSPEAAKWWRDHGYAKSEGQFGFGEDEAEIVEGVTHQKFRHIPDDMINQRTRCVRCGKSS